MKLFHLTLPACALIASAPFAGAAAGSMSASAEAAAGQAALASRLGYYEGGFAFTPTIPTPKMELPRYELIELARLNTEAARLELLDGGKLSQEHQARMQRLFDQFCANHPDVH